LSANDLERPSTAAADLRFLVKDFVIQLQIKVFFSKEWDEDELPMQVR
jgi:hypothetical protein